MRVRKAGPADLPSIAALARKLDLDHPGLEKDTFWVAEDAGRIVGLVGLIRHPDCLELCALGVDPSRRGRGIARALVEAVAADAGGDIHLATVIPAFFEGCGFARTAQAPATFAEKRKTSWCDGCDARLCAVMVRKAS